MKKKKLMYILLVMAGALICVRLFRDFDPALLGADICIALAVVLSRMKSE